MRIKGLVLALAVVGMVVLHQDWWWWKDAKPIIFGFLPAGLWYHALYAVAAAVLMAVMVWWAWPKELENVPGSDQDQKSGGH